MPTEANIIKGFEQQAKDVRAAACIIFTQGVNGTRLPLPGPGETGKPFVEVVEFDNPYCDVRHLYARGVPGLILDHLKYDGVLSGELGNAMIYSSSPDTPERRLDPLGTQVCIEHHEYHKYPEDPSLADTVFWWSVVLLDNIGRYGCKRMLVEEACAARAAHGIPIIPNPLEGSLFFFPAGTSSVLVACTLYDCYGGSVAGRNRIEKTQWDESFCKTRLRPDFRKEIDCCVKAAHCLICEPSGGGWKREDLATAGFLLNKALFYKGLDGHAVELVNLGEVTIGGKKN